MPRSPVLGPPAASATWALYSPSVGAPPSNSTVADGRYFIQAEEQLAGSEWKLVRLHPPHHVMQLHPSPSPLTPHWQLAGSE